jgi:thymidylate synthase (FAD)
MVKLINSYMTEADLCEIARISTGKKSRADEELIRFLIEQQHDSIFEHAVMTFLVEVPIYTARQWQRHRIGSYTEKSGRYSEMEDFELTAGCEPKLKEAMNVEMIALFEYYGQLMKDGLKKEEARQVLPLCTMTKFYWTVNLRSLMNFLSLRMDPHAQQDIRENAKEVCKLFENSYPTIARRWLEREAAIKKFLSERRRIE